MSLRDRTTKKQKIKIQKRRLKPSDAIHLQVEATLDKALEIMLNSTSQVVDEGFATILEDTPISLIQHQHMIERWRYRDPRESSDRYVFSIVNNAPYAEKVNNRYKTYPEGTVTQSGGRAGKDGFITRGLRKIKLGLDEIKVDLAHD